VARRRRWERSEIIVRYRSGTYRRDLVACRNALLRSRSEQRFASATDLAAAAEISYGTVSAFLAGSRQCSKEVVDVILGLLGLSFDDVHYRVRRPDARSQ
jgi:Cro/C1-type HTH DNA-binding domain